MSGATIVVIDESSPRNILGTYEWDRSGGGVLIAPAVSALPSPAEPGEIVWLKTDNKLYRRNDLDTAWDALESAVALHGSTHEEGGADEINVAGLSGVLADDQPAQTHALGGSKHSADTLANLNSKVSDATLDDASDPRDPNAHAVTHENGGSDEINVAGLSGTLADPQTPSGHGSTHQDGGSDEISVAGLSGVLADGQDAAQIQGRDVAATAPSADQVLAWSGSQWEPADQQGGVFGTELDYANDDTVSQTTSTSWQQKLRLSVTGLPAGTYRIAFYYNWQYSVAFRDFQGRVQLDDTTNLFLHQQEPKDPGTDQVYVESGFIHVALNGDHDIDIDYRASQAGDTAYIAFARLEIWRVS